LGKELNICDIFKFYNKNKIMKCFLIVKLIFEYELYDNLASLVWKIYVRTMLKKLEVYNQFDNEFSKCKYFMECTFDN